VQLTPEEGGLTWGQLDAYLERLDDLPPLGATWAVLREVR
jgi:hypothetical protein